METERERREEVMDDIKERQVGIKEAISLTQDSYHRMTSVEPYHMSVAHDGTTED